MFGWSQIDRVSTQDVLCRQARNGTQFIVRTSSLLPRELHLIRRHIERETLETTIGLTSTNQLVIDFCVTSFYFVFLFNNPNELLFIPRMDETGPSRLAFIRRIPFSTSVEYAYQDYAKKVAQRLVLIAEREEQLIREAEALEAGEPFDEVPISVPDPYCAIQVQLGHIGNTPIVLYNTAEGDICTENYLNIDSFWVRSVKLDWGRTLVYTDVYKVIHHYPNSANCAIALLREYHTEIVLLQSALTAIPLSSWESQQFLQYFQSFTDLHKLMPHHIEGGSPVTATTFPSRRGINWHYPDQETDLLSGGHRISNPDFVAPVSGFADSTGKFPLTWVRVFINGGEVALSGIAPSNLTDEIRLEITPEKHCTNFNLQSYAPITWATLEKPTEFKSLVQVPWLSKDTTHTFFGRIDQVAATTTLPFYLKAEIW